MIPMWARLTAVAVLAVVGGALAAWTVGLWAGDDPHATVDHCYITYDRQEQVHSRCVGNWTRGGRGHSGPVHGITVSRSWRVLSTEPDAAYEWEVAVPDDERRPRVLADSGQAWTLSAAAAPAALTPAAGGALFVGLAWAVVSTLSARRRAQAAQPARLIDGRSADAPAPPDRPAAPLSG
ncbi:hypothetical protein [Micromonospora sp. 067-2]|uniref:hypothetical protein n=1 Tax=Micromonospora sp. 067-2 TaxID=2789270 RepID=UPI00397B013C